MSEYDEEGVAAANPDDLSQQSWDDVDQPIPLPNIRFQFQGIAAIYKKPENEGDGHLYSFCYRPIAPVDEVDPEELPEDWQAQKVWVRFDVPKFASHWDVKQFFKINGIDTAGLTREQANAAFKRIKPVIEATVKRRTWTDKATGMQRWGLNLNKIALAGAEDEAAQPDE